MVARSIHEKRFERFVLADSFFHRTALVVQFAAKASSGAMLLARKLPLHSSLISDEKPLASFNIQVDAAIAVLEMGAWVKHSMSKEIQRHCVGQG